MRPGEPYPATFRMSVDPPRVELGLPPRQGGVLPLDHEPVCVVACFLSRALCDVHCVDCTVSIALYLPVDLMGVEPTTPTLQGSVASNGMQALSCGYSLSVLRSRPRR